MIECSSHSLARMTVLPLGVGLGLYEHVRQPGAKHRNQSICVKKEWCLVGNLKGMLHKKIIFLGEQGVIYWRLTSVFLCQRPFIGIMTYTFYSERNLLWRKQVHTKHVPDFLNPTCTFKAMHCSKSKHCFVIWQETLLKTSLYKIFLTSLIYQQLNFKSWWCLVPVENIASFFSNPQRGS